MYSPLPLGGIQQRAHEWAKTQPTLADEIAKLDAAKRKPAPPAPPAPVAPPPVATYQPSPPPPDWDDEPYL